MEVYDMLDRERFPHRLRVGMEIADIRAGELAGMCGLSISAIYRARSAACDMSEEKRKELLEALEKWRPGTLAAVRAAEQEMKRQMPEHDLGGCV